MIVWWLGDCIAFKLVILHYYIHEESSGTPQWYPPITGVKTAPNRVWWSFITPLFFFTQEIFIIIWMYEYIFLQHFPQTHPLIYYHCSLSPKSDILILLSNSWNFNWTVLFKTRTLLLQPMCRFHKKKVRTTSKAYQGIHTCTYFVSKPLNVFGYPLVIKSGYWKSPTNGYFHGKINYKWRIFHGNMWLPAGNNFEPLAITICLNVPRLIF